MNVKLFLVIGTVAAGWTWSNGFAQVTEQNLMSYRPFEIAQSPGIGSAGSPGGGVESGMPAGQTDHGMPSTNNMDRNMGRLSRVAKGARKVIPATGKCLAPGAEEALRVAAAQIP